MRSHLLPMSRPQRGFSSVLVIVALLLMASLMAFGVTILSSTQGGYALELSHARAKQAAQAGLDWGRYQVLRPAVPNCPVLQNVAMPGSLSVFTVSVRCANNSFTEGGVPLKVYTLSVTACLLPAGAPSCPAVSTTSSYVEKTVTTWVER
jgi:MSHA biogenesis protein MshP